MLNTHLPLPFLLVATVPAIALASPSAALRRQEGGLPAAGFARDSDFAKRLATRGLQKQADWVVGRLEKSPGLTEDQKAAIQYLRATVAIAAFDNEREYDKAKAAYDVAKSSLTNYLKASPNGQFAAEAAYEAGDLDRKLGEKVVQQIKVETNAEKIGELRKTGEDAFKASIDYFRERMGKAKERAIEQGKEPSQDNDYLAAAYAVPNTYLSWAFLYPAGDAKRTDNLKRASSNFEEFLLNVSTEIVLYYEAAVKWGNAKRELNESDADEVYNLALGLLYGMDEDNNKFVREPGELIESDRLIILNAAAEIGRLWGLKQQNDQVLQLFSDCRKAIPNLHQYERGADLALEAAKIYDATGKKDLAKAEARKVLQAVPPGNPLFSEARILLERLGEGLGSDADLTVQQVVGPVVAKINEGAFADALKVFQQTRERLHGTTAEAKFGAELHFAGGLAYRQAGRPLEAITCWGVVGDRYLQNKEYAPKALFSMVQTACQLWAQSKATWIEGFVTETVEKLQGAFPEHELTQGAIDLRLQTESKVGGKPALELAKGYEETLKGVQKSDPKYGRVTYEAGKKYFTAGIGTKNRAEKDTARSGAERCWELYLDWAKGASTLDPAELQRIDERSAYVLLSRAQMWLWEPGAAVEKTFAILKDLEERMPKSAAAKGKAIEVEQVKLRAYLQQGALDKAVTVAEGMLSKAPDSPRTAASVKRIGDAIWDETRKNFDKLAPERASQLIDWGLRYHREWINVGARIADYLDAEDYDIAGTRVFSFGLYKNGIAKWPGTYFLVDPAKFGFQDGAVLASDFLGKAIAAHTAGNPDFLNKVRFKRGAALGLLQRWKELAEEYRTIIHEDQLLIDDAGVTKLGAPQAGRIYRPEAVVNDCAYALAELAKKGDKKAGDEALTDALAVAKAMEPKGNQDPPFEFWFARYIALVAAEGNGQRKVVQDLVNLYRSTDKELDKDKFGFRKRIEEIEKRNK